MSESSTMLFIATILLIFCILFAYISKQRIYHIFSIAAASYIGLSFMGESPTMIILMISIILHQIYSVLKT